MFKHFFSKIEDSLNSTIVFLLKSVNESLANICENLKSISSAILKNNKTIEKICLYEGHDEMNIYRGYTIKINDYIKIRQPSIEEITEYGANAYYDMIYTLCSVGADMKWQLDDIGIDYTKIGDYELFCSVLSRLYNVEKTKILFGDALDFSKMQSVYNAELNDNVLIQLLDDGEYIQIDKYVYSAIVDILRKIHKLKRNDEVPGNEATRQILIEDAREEYEENKDKPRKSYLLPLVSAMVNSKEFKRDDETVFQMKIYAFMDSVSRIGKIKNAEVLLQSGYSGFGVDLKKINKDEINWMGDLE